MRYIKDLERVFCSLKKKITGKILLDFIKDVWKIKIELRLFLGGGQG
jgi:hypothetical protein